MSKFEALRIRLGQKIESVGKLCGNLVSNECRKALENLTEIVEILANPSACMNKHTVGHTAAKAELAIMELCHMERRYLTAMSVQSDAHAAVHEYLHVQVVAQALDEFSILRKKAIADRSVPTSELRAKYDRLQQVFVKARIEQATKPVPFSRVERRRHHRSEEDRQRRQAMKGVNPPADKHGKRRKQTAA